MVTSELTSPRTPLHHAAVLVVGLSALGAGLGATWPALAGRVSPHATLAGSVADASSILANNLTAVAAPFGFAVLGLERTRAGRRVADLGTLAIAAMNAIPVGVALGRWQGRLLPYVPQLPLEWMALITALAAWEQARIGGVTARRLCVLASATVLLLAPAAAMETWCTPHRQTTAHQRQTVRESQATCDLTACGRSGGLTLAPECAPAAAGSLQGRPLPSPHCARFRSAATPALTGLTSTHRPPQGGIT